MDRDRRTRIGARAPGAESNPHSQAAHRGVVGPAQNGTTESDYEVREGQKQTRRTPSNAGSRLKRWMLGLNFLLAHVRRIHELHIGTLTAEFFEAFENPVNSIVWVLPSGAAQAGFTVGADYGLCCAE